MPKASHLQLTERKIILQMRDEGYNPSEISRAVLRSRAAIYSVFRDPGKETMLPRSGRPSKLSPITKRHLLREAKKQEMNARELRAFVDTPLGLSSIRRWLHNDPRLAWSRMQRHVQMGPHHEQARLQWANEHVHWSTEQWNKIIFTDEKRFSLDGPDGNARYWRDKNKDPRTFSKRHSGGGSIMIWAGFSIKGKTELAFIDEKMTSLQYCNVLEEFLLPFAYHFHGTAENDWTLLHDGARVHTANLTKQYLSEINASVLPWPAKSPDLNPIENVWGIMSDFVYKNSRQFSTKDELKLVVERAWEHFQEHHIDLLVASMVRRCQEVINKNGKATQY